MDHRSGIYNVGLGIDMGDHVFTDVNDWSRSSPLPVSSASALTSAINCGRQQQDPLTINTSTTIYLPFNYNMSFPCPNLHQAPNLLDFDGWSPISSAGPTTPFSASRRNSIPFMDKQDGIDFTTSVKDEDYLPSLCRSDLSSLNSSFYSVGDSDGGLNQLDALLKDIQPRSQESALSDRLDALTTPLQSSQTRVFKCPSFDCDMTFSQRAQLDEHFRCHNDIKPYICREVGCGQQFTQLGNLKTHLRKHTGERPYHCEICNKSFAQRGNLRAHAAVHLEVKPYPCRLEQCDKTFTQLGNLKNHQLRFHSLAIAEIHGRWDLGDKSPELAQQLDYLRGLYKHANKGIKGRGKDRRARLRRSQQTISSLEESSSSLLSFSSSAPSLSSEPHLASPCRLKQEGMSDITTEYSSSSSSSSSDYGSTIPTSLSIYPYESCFSMLYPFQSPDEVIPPHLFDEYMMSMPMNDSISFQSMNVTE